ncbi:MAG: hypothetical protein QOF32_1621 [Gammaproteobacteria bacterium]|jgi:hypothetical protein|nr:hypothetical protein [Gammaproteobacteria bacterium]
MKRLLLAIFLLLPTAAFAEVRELTLSPTDVFALHGALNSIGTKERICKDGANERPCKEEIKVPPGLSLIIALDLRALRGVIEDYQWAQRKAIGGSGYMERGSREEAEANFRLADLNRIPLKVTLSTFSAKELDEAKVDISPSTRAALLPILDDAR